MSKPLTQKQMAFYGMLEKYPPNVRKIIMEGLLKVASAKLKAKKEADDIEAQKRKAIESKLAIDEFNTEWGKIYVPKIINKHLKDAYENELNNDGQILFDLLKDYKKETFNKLKFSGELIPTVKRITDQYAIDKQRLIRESGYNESEAREILWPEVTAEFRLY
jgi:hypothetical protein